MSAFIADQIIRESKVSLERGQAKYRAYFINTKIYANYKATADTILQTEGYGDSIVSA